MRHRIAHRKLGRTTEHRLSLLRNLAAALFLHERIRTTLAKAKELRPFAEKLITLSKKDSVHARRQALSIVPRRDAVNKLFSELSARFADRPGGYTRILKLGHRPGDGAPMAFIELVDYTFSPKGEAPGKSGKAKKKAKPESARPKDEVEEPDDMAPAAEAEAAAAPDSKDKPAKAKAGAKKPKTAKGKKKAAPAKKKASSKVAAKGKKKTTKKSSKKKP
jgi:large subunit ribosomal protein L17